MATLKIIHSVHNGGSKFYQLFLSKNKETNASYLTQRWGAVGAKGQFKHSSFASASGAELEAAKIVGGKAKRGYEFETESDIEVDNATQIYRNLQIKTDSDTAEQTTDHLSQVFSGMARSFTSEDDDGMYGRPAAPPAPVVFHDELQGSW